MVKVDRILFGFCSVLIAGLLGWMFYTTTFFSSDFNFSVLYDIDDILFHKCLDYMRNQLNNYQYNDFLACVQHGYGAAYWLLVYFITAPSMIWGPDWLTILIPRNISLVAYIFCLVAFYRIARIRGATAAQTLLAILLIFTCAVPYNAVTRFHNHSFLAALILWSLYFLLREGKDKESTQRDLVYAAVLFGVAVGVKVVALFMGPVFLLLFNYKLNNSHLKENVKGFCVFIVAAAIAFTPAILYVVVGDFQSLKNDFGQLNFVINRVDHGPTEDFFKHLWEDIFNVYYCLPVMIFGFGLSLYLYLKSDRKSWRKNIIPIVTCLILFIILIVTAMTRRNTYLMRPYIIGQIFIFTLIFVEWMVRVRWAKFAMFLVIGINVYFNFPVLQQYFFEHREFNKSEQTQHKLKKYDIYKAQNLLKDSDGVLIDYAVVFPLGLIKNIAKVDFAFGRNIDLRDKDIFIFDKNEPNFFKTCEVLAPEEGMSLKDCSFVQNVHDGKPPYKIVFEDDDVRVVRWAPN